MSRVRAAFALLLAAACAATAQPPKKEPPKEKEPPRLDLKSLGAALTELGAEPKVVDGAFQKIRWNTKSWTSPVWVSVSGDKKTVWLYTEFPLRPDCDKAPADAWRKLLEKNDEIAPSHFALDERARRLTLRRPVTNAEVTPAVLRKELNAFLDLIQKTPDLWRPAAFLPAMTPEAEKLLSQLAGKWKLAASADRGVPVPEDKLGRFAFEFDGRQMRALQDGREALKATVYLELSGGRANFDFVADEATDVGILKLDGDTLTLCSASGSTKRPTEFTSLPKSNSLLMVLKRQKE